MSDQDLLNHGSVNCSRHRRLDMPRNRLIPLLRPGEKMANVRSCRGQSWPHLKARMPSGAYLATQRDTFFLNKLKSSRNSFCGPANEGKFKHHHKHANDRRLNHVIFRRVMRARVGVRGGGGGVRALLPHVRRRVRVREEALGLRGFWG